LVTGLAGLALLMCVGLGYIMGFKLESLPLADPGTLPADLAQWRSPDAASRGRILAVVTNAEKVGASEIAAGFELTELSRAYYIFSVKGFEVDIASPKGGRPLEASPGTVGRHELNAMLWGDCAPPSDPLRMHIYELRQSLTKALGSPVIDTVRGFGYRISSRHADA
jgi:hypothetical protein